MCGLSMHQCFFIDSHIVFISILFLATTLTLAILKHMLVWKFGIQIENGCQQAFVTHSARITLTISKSTSLVHYSLSKELEAK